MDKNEENLDNPNSNSDHIINEDLNEEQLDWVQMRLRRSEHTTSFLKNQETDNGKLEWFEDENGRVREVQDKDLIKKFVKKVVAR